MQQSTSDDTAANGSIVKPEPMLSLIGSHNDSARKVPPTTSGTVTFSSSRLLCAGNSFVCRGGRISGSSASLLTLLPIWESDSIRTTLRQSVPASVSYPTSMNRTSLNDTGTNVQLPVTGYQLHSRPLSSLQRNFDQSSTSPNSRTVSSRMKKSAELRSSRPWKCSTLVDEGPFCFRLTSFSITGATTTDRVGQSSLSTTSACRDWRSAADLVTNVHEHETTDEISTTSRAAVRNCDGNCNGNIIGREPASTDVVFAEEQTTVRQRASGTDPTKQKQNGNYEKSINYAAESDRHRCRQADVVTGDMISSELQSCISAAAGSAPYSRPTVDVGENAAIRSRRSCSETNTANSSTTMKLQPSRPPPSSSSSTSARPCSGLAARILRRPAASRTPFQSASTSRADVEDAAVDRRRTNRGVDEFRERVAAASIRTRSAATYAGRFDNGESNVNPAGVDHCKSPLRALKTTGPDCIGVAKRSTSTNKSTVCSDATYTDDDDVNSDIADPVRVAAADAAMMASRYDGEGDSFFKLIPVWSSTALAVRRKNDGRKNVTVFDGSRNEDHRAVGDSMPVGDGRWPRERDGGVCIENCGNDADDDCEQTRQPSTPSVPADHQPLSSSSDVDRFSLSSNAAYCRLSTESRPDFTATVYRLIVYPANDRDRRPAGRNPVVDHALLRLQTELAVSAVTHFFHPCRSLDILFVADLRPHLDRRRVLLGGNRVRPRCRRRLLDDAVVDRLRCLVVLSDDAGRLLRHDQQAFVPSLAAALDIDTEQIAVLVGAGAG